MIEEYIVVDLEMTGLNSAKDKILEIGAVHVQKGKIVETFETLVNPGGKIPEPIVALTGITEEMVQEGLSQTEGVSRFLEFQKGLPLVGHNISFDYGFLRQAAVNGGVCWEASVIDTLKLARTLLKEPEKKTLEALCEYYGIFREEKHRACADAIATAEVLERLSGEFGETHPELFAPVVLPIKVKKQGPAGLRQKKYLKELAEYHKIELEADIDTLTKSEASRMTDRIIHTYGRIPGRRTN